MSTVADWDKFKEEPAYERVANDRLVLAKSIAKVKRPNDLLDLERCETIQMETGTINRALMVNQVLMAGDNAGYLG
jgi:hypothetical protein